MIRRPAYSLLFALALVAPSLCAGEAVEIAPAAADSTAAAAADTTTDAVLTEFDNGLRLLVLPKPDWKLARVNTYLSLRGASRNGGMAHLVEHLMFRSSENCPAGSLQDSLTLLTTWRQGSTSPRSVYTRSHCLPALLPRLLYVEADRYARLRPDSTDLAHETERILGEMDYRTELYTSMGLNLRVIAMAYEGSEAAGDPLLGSAEDIAAVGMAEADSFIATWLRPDRTVVFVSGPVDPDTVRAQVAATFGTWSATGPAPELRDLPPRPDPRRFVTRTDDRNDMLAVGFRLPYGTPEEAAVVHLAESIMDREDGYPHLYVFEDEALLILHVYSRWSRERSDEDAAQLAIDQFWRETRTVKHRVHNDWLFERNRAEHVEELRKRLNQPYRRTRWRALRLADGRDLPDPDVMAAMIDTLPQARIHEYFNEQFVAERAFVAFAAGRAPSDPDLMYRNRRKRLSINPYLVDGAGPERFGQAEIGPVLTAAVGAGIGRVQRDVLPNGIPVHLLGLPNENDVHLGGVRTFPALADEAPGRDPGRLRVYGWLANRGYDSKGADIEPRGEDNGWHTDIDTDVNSLRITAHGPVGRLDDVTAAMHKRLVVDHLDPFLLKWYRERHHNWVADWVDRPWVRARGWRDAAVLGPDHPRCGWARPDAESVKSWNAGKANKLHRQLCRTGNLELVVAGDLDLAQVRDVFDPTFGRMDEFESGSFPVVSAACTTVTGVVVDDRTSEVAAVDVAFPPRPLADEPALGPVDLMVVEHLVESRLRVAIATANLDSVSASVEFVPVGASALPVVHIVCSPPDAAQVLDLVGQEVRRFTSDPPGADEEARARLPVMRSLVNGFIDADDACDQLVFFARFGEVPADALAELAGRDYGIVAQGLAGLFPPDRYAWTVTGSMLLPAIRGLGSELQ